MKIAPSMTSAVLAAACIAAITPLPATAQTLEKIAHEHKITVSYREAAVPFSYLLTPSKPVGFSVDLTEAIVDDIRNKLGMPDLAVARIPVTGQNRIPLLVQGAYDLECGSTTNNAARGKDVAFSTNFFYAGTRVLVKKSSNVTRYEDLAGKRVATVAGSTNEKVIQQYASEHGLALTVVPGKDYSDALHVLEDDGAEALALDDVLLYGMKANAKQPELFEVVGETLQIEPYACMFRKNDPEFKRVVDGAMSRLTRSGEFERLYDKWFREPIPPNGARLDMPMSARLRANLRERSDRPER
ncbi:transporter substrate-binding domain-containing protein [Paraburkholderia sp. NMBU_R16]|uniref:amino acid ABC transporter substrate-binding protein n=1 Tax=Paraburkholderia sp. NMBU_R16 TaxID=2698676 RepID=UPI00156489FA|nr:amino acid ABC transporter substrate-binding protein [Paraburkholderia sp. NMBU_R16]NRO98755.1 transporter substrate-binding domain-containing protein [Paraburkholderia sp. NMBU_R16]